MTGFSLILNKNWVAIAAFPIKKSIILLYQNRALVVCPKSYRTFNFSEWVQESINNNCNEGIKTTSCIISKPEIILLKPYGGMPYNKVPFTRKNIFMRDNYTCQYCLKQLPRNKLTIDHVIPRSKNGTNSFENCVTSCLKCNNKKSDKLLREVNLFLKKKPIRPKWHPAIGLENLPDSWNSFIKNKI